MSTGLRSNSAGLLGPCPFLCTIEKLLGTRSFGTPFRNLAQLEPLGFVITIKELSLVDIEGYLQSGSPVIACVHTADLSYWTIAADYAVVVVGTDDKNVYINDPSQSQAPQTVPRVEFELAQLNFDNLCAVIAT